MDLYLRSGSLPTVPASATTYTFATATLSGSLGAWTQGVPTSDGNPLWSTNAPAIARTATVSIPSASWSTPIIIAQDGASGSGGGSGTSNVSGTFTCPGGGGTTLVSPALTTLCPAGLRAIQVTGTWSSASANLSLLLMLDGANIGNCSLTLGGGTIAMTPAPAWQTVTAGSHTIQLQIAGGPSVSVLLNCNIST